MKVEHVVPGLRRVTLRAVVSWEWTGEGGSHNVASADGSDFEFASGNPQEQQEPFTLSTRAASRSTTARHTGRSG